MAAPYLADPEDLAILTGLPSNSPALLLALDRASERFRSEVGHPVHLITGEVIRLDGDGGDTLFLPAAPFTTIAVKVDGTAVTDFVASRRSGYLRRVERWPDGLENIEITYTHGYAVIPGAIRDAVLEQAAVQALVRAGVQQETAGPQSVTWGTQATTGVTRKWADAVQNYSLGRGDRS
jgi:hypothetical protein